MSSIIQATLENVDAQRKTAIKAAENAGYTVSEDMSIAALGQLFGETPEETSYKYWHRPKD